MPTETILQTSIWLIVSLLCSLRSNVSNFLTVGKSECQDKHGKFNKGTFSPFTQKLMAHTSLKKPHGVI